MTIYEALMKTADHIEAYPHLYNFADASMPTHPGSRVCILGRLGQIMGISTYNADLVAPVTINMDAHTFFRRMLDLMPSFGANLYNPQLVVPALRLFAQSYKTQMIPQAIREIFNPTTPKEQPYAVV